MPASPPGSRRMFEEALTAIRPYLPPQQAHNPFALVGGYALNLHGRTRYTTDLDFAITGQSLQHWESALNAQSRGLVRTLTESIRVLTSPGAITVRGHHVVTIQELTILKAEAVMGRDELKDYENLLWIPQTMEARGEQPRTMLPAAGGQVVARTPVEGIENGLQDAAKILLGEGRLLEVSKWGRMKINEKGRTKHVLFEFMRTSCT